LDRRALLAGGGAPRRVSRGVDVGHLSPLKPAHRSFGGFALSRRYRCSTAVDETDPLLAGFELRPVPRYQGMQVLPRCENEHRNAVGAQVGAPIVSSVRSR